MAPECGGAWWRIERACWRVVPTGFVHTECFIYFLRHHAPDARTTTLLEDVHGWERGRGALPRCDHKGDDVPAEEDGRQGSDGKH